MIAVYRESWGAEGGLHQGALAGVVGGRAGGEAVAEEEARLLDEGPALVEEPLVGEVEPAHQIGARHHVRGTVPHADSDDGPVIAQPLEEGQWIGCEPR
ncbi:hypothetical protein OG268_01830 [Streptomyces uncialis]|nr:hypothetical protein OG268_01830 [Streptomyces uncialis]